MTSVMAPLASFLAPAERDEPVDPVATYRMLGVRSFGRGAFAAPSLNGDATAYRTLRKTKAFDVVYPKLMAWEGAFAMVPSELAGRWVSPEFCLFEVDDTRADCQYVAHLLAWEEFRDGLLEQSSGTNARRRRLQPQVFLAHRVPLPRLAEQRRIAGYLDRFAAAGDRMRDSNQMYAVAKQSLMDYALSCLQAPMRSIGSVTELARDAVLVDPTETYRTIGIMNRGKGVFERQPIIGSSTKYARYFRVAAGQLTYSKLFGWEGSVAVIPSEYDGYFVSAEFPTFNLDSAQVLTKYVDHIIRSSGFMRQLSLATTGMGQRRQRVNVSDFRAIEVPLPSLPAQRRTVNYLDKLAYASVLGRHRAEVGSALLHAARNEVFSDLR